MIRDTQAQVDKNSREYLTFQRNTGRLTMLAFAAFTVVNLVLLVTQTNYFFLFSAAVPYYLTMFGMAFDSGAVGNYTIAALGISAAILAVYLLCWVFSKKRNGWLVMALALAVMDLIALIGVSLTMGIFTIKVLDLAIHGIAVWEIVQALRAHNKLEKLTPDGRLRKRLDK